MGAVITNQSLPEHFLFNLNKLKECYQLALFEATVIYCRNLIELAMFEALRRKGQIKSTKKTADIAEYSLKEILRRVKPYLYELNFDEARKVISYANDVLHSKYKKVIVSENMAYNSIKTTFAVIEELFS